METVKLVNRGLEGEGEILCLQNPETLKIYDLDTIDRTYVNGTFKDFEETDISHIYHKEGHLARIDVLESGNVILYVQ
jgi:hypothetical protein